MYPNGAYCPSNSFDFLAVTSRRGNAKNSDEPPFETLSGWFNATRSGILNDRRGSRLDVAAVELEEDDDVADENERWAEDDDVRALNFVVSALVMSLSSDAYEEEYVKTLFVGLAGSNVTTSNGILRGFAVRGS